MTRTPRSLRRRSEPSSIGGAWISPGYVQYCRWVGVCNPDGQGLGVFISNHGLPNFLPGFLGGGDNGVLHLDLGISSTNGTPVMDIIAERFPRTLVLAGTSLVLWLLLALIIGVTAAVKRYSKVDSAITVFNYVGVLVPDVLAGAVAHHHLLGAAGLVPGRRDVGFPQRTRYSRPRRGGGALFKDPLFTVGDLVRHLTLPVVTLVAVSVAGRLAGSSAPR